LRRIEKRSRDRLLVAFFLIVSGVARCSGADCLPAPAGLISWWPGDGNANDIFGTNHGTLQGGATANGAGIADSAFVFDGTKSLCADRRFGGTTAQ